MLYEKYIRLNIPVIVEAPTPSGQMSGGDSGGDGGGGGGGGGDADEGGAGCDGHDFERRSNNDVNSNRKGKKKKREKKKKNGECNILTMWNKEGLLRYHADVKVHVATRPLPSLPTDGNNPFASDPKVDTMTMREFIDTIMLAQRGEGEQVHDDGAGSNSNSPKNATNPEQRYVFNTMNNLKDDLVGCDILELLDDAFEAGARQQQPPPQHQRPTSAPEPPPSLFVTSHNTLSGEYEGHFEF